MANPWERIDLNKYETHMQSENVYQLQTLSDITKQQLNDYPNTNVVILGVTGGNGLEHIDTGRTKKVYGIDINREYLDVCKRRYKQLDSVLELICCDLSDTDVVLPFSNILICNLIVEYLGINQFIDLISNNKGQIETLSCTIQSNKNNSFVSESDLTAFLDPLMSIHHDIDTEGLMQKLPVTGFCCIKKVTYPLPNGKEFIRMDFKPSEK